MNPDIITTSLVLKIFGYSETALNRDYVGTAFKLSGRMWDAVKQNGLKNKGKNVWVYDADHEVFAGVELEESTAPNTALEEKTVTFNKYAYYKHMGPYNLIKQKGQEMTRWLADNGYKIIHPYIEIYGHWTGDESKLETELLMGLE